VALISERLQSVRRGLFVGREAERSFFQAALASPEPPFFVLYTHGLGGVGKTALLRELVALCITQGIHCALVDGRNIEPSPQAFLSALALANGLTPANGLDVGDSVVQFLSEREGRYVLFIDTYELLSPLDQWLRETFLPQLPDTGLVVLASRQPPSQGWHLDTGWQSLLRTLSLRNLSPQESQRYLLQRNVPREQHQVVLDFTHGHPLALSLVADLFAQHKLAPQESHSLWSSVLDVQGAIDTVQVLVEHLVREACGERHRAALEACALLHLTTESLLHEMLQPETGQPSAHGSAHGQAETGQPSSHELFGWLRSLSLMEVGPSGVFPHDMAREAIVADLRWRDPKWYAELHHRARRYYTARLQQTSGRQQQDVLFDYIFLHRSNTVVRPFLEWRENGKLSPSPADAKDIPQLVSLVQKHEGPESARIAAHWFKRQPEGALVIRAPNSSIAGFLCTISLQKATAEDLSLDPGANAASAYLSSHAPLRAGEEALHFRFWMAAETYQAVSPAQSLIFVKIVQQYFNTPNLALSFLPCADPEFWSPIFSYADGVALQEAQFEVGSRRYGTYSHDWRVVPPLAWLGQMADREISESFDKASAPGRTEQMIVLSEPEFRAALQSALRHLLRPGELSQNPLLRSRLVMGRSGVATHATKAQVLREIIQAACQRVQQAPRTQKFYLPLYHTYLHPAANQEHAAELLDISLSTFRRHLKEGVSRVIQDLWEQEMRA